MSAYIAHILAVIMHSAEYNINQKCELGNQTDNTEKNAAESQSDLFSRFLMPAACPGLLLFFLSVWTKLAPSVPPAPWSSVLLHTHTDTGLHTHAAYTTEQGHICTHYDICHMYILSWTIHTQLALEGWEHVAYQQCMWLLIRFGPAEQASPAAL